MQFSRILGAAVAVLFVGSMAMPWSAHAVVLPVIEVTPHLMANVFGSPSYAGNEANAVQGLHNGLSSFGTPGTPTHFQAQSNVTSAQVVVTGFPSWRGQVDPGTVFGPAFTNELGNRMHFGYRIDGMGGQISISQLSFAATSTDPFNALAFGFAAGLYTYNSGNQGVLKGDDGLLWTADDTFVTGGLNTQLVDGLVGRGSGNSFAAYCPGCSLQDQQVAINDVAAYPGADFTFTGTYALGGATGSGTFNISSAEVPEPASFALLGASLLGLGFVRRRSVS